MPHGDQGKPDNTLIYKANTENKRMAHSGVIMVVEDVAVARTALNWAVHNILRAGDLITLLYCFEPSPPSTSTRGLQKKSKSESSIVAAMHRQRLHRLKGFQLALSFKDICAKNLEVKVEIIVTEGGLCQTLSSLAKKTGASIIILGLHEHSFVYKTAMADDFFVGLSCRVLAVKQSREGSLATPSFSRVEIVRVEKLRAHTNQLHKLLEIEEMMMKFLNCWGC